MSYQSMSIMLNLTTCNICMQAYSILSSSSNSKSSDPHAHSHTSDSSLLFPLPTLVVQPPALYTAAGIPASMHTPTLCFEGHSPSTMFHQETCTYQET